MDKQCAFESECKLSNDCGKDGVDVSRCVYRAEEKCILKDDECCFFPNCDYKNWQRKEQECEFLKNITTLQSKDIHDKKQQLNQLKAENEKMEKGYIELTEIVSPYIDDFTGYNEELKGFDIVLCVKELMQQLDRLKEEVEKQRALKQTYLTCYKTKIRKKKKRKEIKWKM